MEKLRYSKQREIVYDCLKSTKCHPSAEWVYRQVKQCLPEISLATVYRNLKQLVQVGRANKVVVQNDVERFDADTSSHSHFICKECGGVFDVDHVGELPRIDSQFEIDFVSVQFYGLCSCCKIKN